MATAKTNRDHTGKSAGFMQMLPDKSELLLRGAFDDLIAFGKLFLPGDFRKSPTPAFHYEVGDELISDSTKPCAIILPRGHAKTTLIKASIIRDFCFSKAAAAWGFAPSERHLFYGWVSSNQKKSKNNVAYVKLHLAHNERIHYFFGDMRGEVWNQEDLVTAYGDRLVSSSNLTSMRGDTLATIEKGAVRYSRVFIDDAENEDNTRTQSSREKIVDNIMNGIYPAIIKNEPGCRLFLIETPVHFDSFAQRVLDRWAHVKKEGKEDEYMWRVLSYKATQPDLPGGVLWHPYMSRETLDEIKQTYVESPRGVSGYYQEYELEVQNFENASWNANHIRYWKGYYDWREGQSWLVIDGQSVPVNTFLGCDPATDIETKDTDFSVIMVIAVDELNNIYVIDYVRERSIPTLALKDSSGEISGKKGVVDHIVEMYRKYHCKSGTVEDVAMNRSIFQALNDFRRKHNAYDIAIIPEKPGGTQKVNRIYSVLNGRFADAAIHYREHHFDLIDETLKFGPKMAHDDTIETLMYAVLHSYPIKGVSIDNEGRLQKPRRKAKPWIIA